MSVRRTMDYSITDESRCMQNGIDLSLMQCVSMDG